MRKGNNYTPRKDKKTEKTYHKHYRERSVNNGIPMSKLVKDRINKTYYPIKPGKYDYIQNSIFEILSAYTCMVPFDREQYEKVMKSILTLSEDKSCLILFNHDNFATMTAFIKEMYDHAKTMRQDAKDTKEIIDLKKNVHTIVGPAITTQKQIRSINGISNVIKTVPARDNIPEITKKLDSLRTKFLKQFIELSNTGGQIFLMAPTGTRDVIRRNEDGTIQSILFQDDDAIPQTARIIKSFAEKGNKVILVGTNGTGLKRPGIKKVQERDNNRTSSDVYIDVKEITPEECVSLVEQKKIMDTIASLVKDDKGISIGQTIDSESFDLYKYSPQDIDIKEDLHENKYFQDSIRKKIVRKLYTLLK